MRDVLMSKWWIEAVTTLNRLVDDGRYKEKEKIRNAIGKGVFLLFEKSI